MSAIQYPSLLLVIRFPESSHDCDDFSDFLAFDDLDILEDYRLDISMQETQIWSLGWERPLDKGMAAHCSIPAWSCDKMNLIVPRITVLATVVENLPGIEET